jgi:hypothetical protein
MVHSEMYLITLGCEIRPIWRHHPSVADETINRGKACAQFCSKVAHRSERREVRIQEVNAGDAAIWAADEAVDKNVPMRARRGAQKRAVPRRNHHSPATSTKQQTISDERTKQAMSRIRSLILKCMTVL